jgi:hypothetical protein
VPTFRVQIILADARIPGITRGLRSGRRRENQSSVEPTRRVRRAPRNGESVQEYERSQKIGAQADEVFAWLSHVGNLPEYLPTVSDASIERPSAGDVPGRRIRTTPQYPGKEEGTFDAEGYLDVDEGARRMEWGAEVCRDYSGWFAVAVGCDGASEITVHPSFG